MKKQLSFIGLSLGLFAGLGWALQSQIRAVTAQNGGESSENWGLNLFSSPKIDPNYLSFTDETGQERTIKLINPTFLHNEKRNYYGQDAPDNLNVIWKHNLGTGKTSVGGKVLTWSGAGWTGQPLLVEEDGELFLIQGAYDHHLKKIRAKDGKLIWQYRFDDVIKGTGTLWINRKADSTAARCLVLQGSRAGAGLAAPFAPSFRGVSYFSGKEFWRLNSVRTLCYSRDVDGSALIINDTAYLSLENSIFHVFNPDPAKAELRDKMLQPQIYKNTDTLYWVSDNKAHGGNLVTESSPARLGNRVYIASGSGHVWGYNLQTQSIDWEYFIGSDIDGSPVVTYDDCLLISVEKQYIAGQGGILKLNPAKEPKDALVWYYPTGNRRFASWEGGVIGTAAVNDAYRKPNQKALAATLAIDGFLHIIEHDKIDTTKKVKLFDGKTEVPTPVLVYKHQVGGSISSPVIIDNRIIATGYDGTYLFEFDENHKFKVLARNEVRCEATPFVHNGRIYLASRDGFLYCFGR